MNSLGYSSLDELYGNTSNDKSTDLSLLNVEKESICNLAKTRAKPRRAHAYKNLGKYAQFDGTSNENNNKIMTTNDVPKTRLYKQTKDCKSEMEVEEEFAIKPYNITGVSEVNLASFEPEIDLPVDYELKKYILDEDYLKKGKNKNSIKDAHSALNDRHFMNIATNVVDYDNPNDVMDDTAEPEKPLLKNNLGQNKVRKNNNSNKNANTLNDDDNELNENMVDKYLMLLLYILSGFLLILIMEQILQLGIKMRL